MTIIEIYPEKRRNGCRVRKIHFNFSLNQELSGIDRIGYLSLYAGQAINPDRPLVFNVDRIDSYMEKYDVLPTFSTPLVSARFKNEFDDLGDDIQFLNAVRPIPNDNDRNIPIHSILYRAAPP